MRDKTVRDHNVTFPETAIFPANRPNSAPNRRLLRLKTAAVYLSLSPWKLRALIQDGKLPVVQDTEGSPFLLDLRDLDAFVERNKRMTPL
jgi:excisionase family DNA binding protein